MTGTFQPNEALAAFWRELRFAARSLGRTKGLTATVVVTLALGIGANSAMFSVVRGVLLRPLANRDENRLIFISQSARGIGAEHAAFSVPEIKDLEARVKSLSEFGDFSTMPVLGERRMPWARDARRRAGLRACPIVAR